LNLVFSTKLFRDSNIARISHKPSQTCGTHTNNDTYLEQILWWAANWLNNDVEEREERLVVSLQPAWAQEPKVYCMRERQMSHILNAKG
jgi:hypothetical protein